jgi:hypothetical protein
VLGTAEVAGTVVSTSGADVTAVSKDLQRILYRTICRMRRLIRPRPTLS